MPKLRLSLTLLMIWCTATLSAQFTAIPDINFESYLIEQNIDSDNIVNGQVTTSDLEGIEVLSISGLDYPIADMTGIEDFTSLFELNLTDHPALSALDITSNTQLLELVLVDCAITSVNASQCPNLESIKYTMSEPSSSVLTGLNLQNGNNVALTSVTISDNPNLGCILVDNATDAANDAGSYGLWQHDTLVSFGEISGCTLPVACNYDPAACFDDGSCLFWYGCTDPAACNFNPLATCDDGFCQIPPANDDCENAEHLVSGVPTTGNTFSACGPALVPSCGNWNTNDVWYEITSTTGGEITVYTTLNGTMTASRLSVWDSCGGIEWYCNENPGDGSTLASSITFKPSCGETWLVQVSSPDFGFEGSFDIQYDELPDDVQCDDPAACNYSPCSSSDVKCRYPGCISPSACNYDDQAGCDDGSCIAALPSTDETYCLYEFNNDCTLDGDNLCVNGNVIFPSGVDYSQELDYDLIESITVSIFWTSCVGATLTIDLNGFVIYSNSSTYCTCEDALILEFLNADLPPLTAGQDFLNITFDDEVYLGAVIVDVTHSDAGVDGCNDPAACNYNAAANCDDGSCEYASCASACEEDLNGDGQIGTGDLLTMLAVFGTGCPGPPCFGDLSDDLQIGTSDLLIVLAAFGTSCP